MSLNKEKSNERFFKVNPNKKREYAKNYK